MKIIKKQKNSRNCIICGLDNDASVKAPFYEMEDKSLLTIFRFKDIHQSYPQRVHGGLITAMLDELVGRAIWIDNPKALGVTTNINIKFRKPVAYDQKLIGVARLTKNTNLFFGGIGKIFNENGDVLAEADIKFIKQEISQIADMHEDIEMPYDLTDDLIEFDMDKFKLD